MLATLIHLLKTGMATTTEVFPDLPSHARGLPTLTDAPCTDCGVCAPVCPTAAIEVRAPQVRLDLGACIACGLCTAACPTGTIAPDRRTRVAVRRREDLELETGKPRSEAIAKPSPLRRSLHFREVSTGDNATDLEVAATGNAIFDAGRFGVHVVASPRHADALVVTGPVGLAMHEPLRRCYDAMAEPRLVIAAGTSAISGGLHRGGYAQANGVDAVLPVAVYIPGHPPHPWMLMHGIFLAMGRTP